MFLDFTTLVVRVLWILLISHLPRLLYLLSLATHRLQLSLLMAFELARFCLACAYLLLWLLCGSSRDDLWLDVMASKIDALARSRMESHFPSSLCSSQHL